MRSGIFLSGCLGGEGFSSAGSRSPSRAPAGGREETRSLLVLQAPFHATDIKNSLGYSRLCREITGLIEKFS